MSKTKINIVWLKRDIRSQDHMPFFVAENDSTPFLPIYIFEPSILNHPDSSLRHQQFIYHSILNLNQILSKYKKEVIIFHGETKEVFRSLIKNFEVNRVFSYQESGIKKTWDRDKSIKNILIQQKILWTEFQRDGILRGIKNRDGWDKNWYITMSKPIIQNKYKSSYQPVFNHSLNLPKSYENQLLAYPIKYQKPGEDYASKYLKSFCQERGKNYSKYISKPTESRMSCGRLSPYLAWGNISIKQAAQYVKNHPNYNSNKRSFNGLLTRLKWHCHFIQKFENECTYETVCVNKGYETMPYESNPKHIEAWKSGKTGWPMVDACMRCLKETGWINFRMRAMLVSVFCHQLDCNWKEGVYHLANLFLDYEPGIHYTQFQMQAGTTGINTIRMYNPVKQSTDHDTDGIFIKKWVNELKDIPVEFIHEPWKLTELDLQMNDIKCEYPKPLVDLVHSGKKARTKIWSYKKSDEVKKEAKRIVKLHTRDQR